jgi:transcriptional regulator with GAF, ATPase, and Fis domain
VRRGWPLALSTQDAETDPERSVQHEREARPGLAGLTLLDAKGRATTALFTDDAAPEIDQAQYDSDRGPCLEAYRIRQILRVDDMASDDRWPEFAQTARSHGIQSSVSLPLIVGDEGIGALNMYARSGEQFDASSEAIGQTFAAQAAVAVANGVAYWEKSTLAEQLATAIESRAVIEQAKGVLMATSGCTPDEAFNLLREQSQALNEKLRDIAVRIVREQQRRP